MPPSQQRKGPSRAEKTRQNRNRMLDSAGELFIEEGYAATTMGQIAERAGVAVQTLYWTFRTKGLLLREVVETAAAGEPDAPPVMERPWVHEMLSADSAQRVLALAVEHGTDILERVAPLWPAVIAAAAADPELERYWQGVHEGRRGGMERIVGRIAELGALREGLAPQRAVDVGAVILGHDVYRSLVREAGWPVTEYKAWLFASVVRQLLAKSRISRSAYADLSFADAIAGA